MNTLPSKRSSNSPVSRSDKQVVSVSESEDATLPGDLQMQAKEPDTAADGSEGIHPPMKKAKDSMQNEIMSSADQLYQQAQELINEINVKRKNDTSLLADFKKTMEIQVEGWCSSLEKVLYVAYDRNSVIIQEKLQDLYATLDRISKLEQELIQFKDALGVLYSDVQNTAD